MDRVQFIHYAELGNRTMKSVGNYTTTYTYGDSQNRLDSAEGGPVPFKTMTFAWDLAGRLASSSDGVSYLYDGLGRRIQKTEPTQTTLYHYDSSGRIISETSPAGAKIRDYIYLGNKLVAVDGCITVSPPAACTERQWYHTDIAGSVLARSDSAGNIVRFDYQPWGEPWTAPATAAGDRQYNGRIFDANTGFHDYGARMYWPEIGRFISVDPAEPDKENPATFNRYAYVLNNPYKYVDPNGHVATWVTGLLGLFFGGAYGAITSALSEEGFNWNAVTYWGGAGAVAGLTAGLGVNAYLAATATVSVAELTATAGPAIGTAIRIPEGWVGRVAENGKGIVFQEAGATGNANMIRIMDPTSQYPSGYMRFFNSYGQPLDVFGKPGGPAATHIPLDYLGKINWPLAATVEMPLAQEAGPEIFIQP